MLFLYSYSLDKKKVLIVSLLKRIYGLLLTDFVDRELKKSDFTILAENLLDVFLCDIARQISNKNRVKMLWTRRS